MAIRAYTFSPPNLQVRIKLFKSSHLQTQFRHCNKIRPTTCSTKVLRAELADSSKVKMGSFDKEKLQKAVKEFPWKKAKNLILQRTVSVGKKAFVTVFILGFCSDVLFSFTRNKELLVPIGLLVGCFMTDLLKEISQELFHISRLEKSLSWKPAAGISCFFVFTKFISVFLPLQGHVFLLNFANGGFMQVLWLWLRSSERIHSDNGDCQTAMESGDSI